MKNRPDKPGCCWWWVNSKGESVIALICDGVLPGVGHVLVDDFSGYELEELENMAYFDRWLGKAHPPKKVQRFDFYTGKVDRARYGMWVLFEDVKEFLLKGEDK